MDNLFSTHPAVENRIAQLQQIASEMGASFAPSSDRIAGATGPKARPRGPWG